MKTLTGIARLTPTISILILLAAPSAAFATAKVGVSVFGGYQTYTMSDINDELISPINAALLGTGFKMDEISSGAGYGGGIRVRTEGNLVIGLDYNRLIGGTDLTAPGGTFKFDAPADAITGTVTYLFPSASKARFGLGGGVGFYMADAVASLYDSGTSSYVESNLKGDGFGLHGLGAMDVTLSPAVHADLSVGYRYAKTTDLESEGVKIVKSNGDDATLDWSGFMSQAGLSFYFGAK